MGKKNPFYKASAPGKFGNLGDSLRSKALCNSADPQRACFKNRFHNISRKINRNLKTKDVQ